MKITITRRDVDGLSGDVDRLPSARSGPPRCTPPPCTACHQGPAPRLAPVHCVRPKVRPSALPVRPKAQRVRGGRSSAPAQLRPQNQGSREESTWIAMCA